MDDHERDLGNAIRVKHAGAIFASVLLVLLIGFVEMYETDWLASFVPQDNGVDEPIAAESLTDIPEEPTCVQLEAEFAAKLEQAQPCQVDADCSLARFECPFQCVNSVSTSILAELKREETAFQQTCNRCESSCPQTLTKWRAACVRQRCIVMDRSIEELEEATRRLLNE